MKSVFSILAGIFLLCSAPLSRADVVYVGYGEDGYTLEHEVKENKRFLTGYNTTDLDLNGDETLYIKSMYRFFKSSGKEMVRVQTDLDVVGTWEGTYKEGYDMAYKLEENVLIGENASWRDTYFYTYLFYETTSDSAINYHSYWEDMAPGETGYLGFSFTGSGDTINYGWAELYIDDKNGEVTLFGYAYEDSGQAILTGDTGSPVPIPGSLWLLGSSMAALAGISRKRPN